MARLMGIVNVTPDSFSDGGLFLEPERAIAHARRLADEGADLLDIGGESTRPGARGVSATEELERVGPVLEGIRAAEAPLAGATISIDTSKVAVAEMALDVGVEIVNDVTALRSEPELAALCASRGCGLVLMHMQGTPRTMQEHPSYETWWTTSGLSWRSGSSSRSPRAWRRNGSGSTPGSASARPWSTTSSSCGGSTSWASSAGRS